MKSPALEARVIARGEGWEFWLVGENVHRAREGAQADTQGFPMGARWECTISHWNRFRAVFSWAADV